MTGEGTSRIDTILANSAAAQLIAKLEQLYTSALAFDHIPILCTLNVEAFNDTINSIAKPALLEHPDLKGLSQKQRCDYEKHNSTVFKRIWSKYDDDFQNAAKINDHEAVHRIWCNAAEEFLWWLIGLHPRSEELG